MRYLKCLLLVAMVTVTTGCLEASFELAPESRLPKWFAAPEGVARDQLSVRLDSYMTSSGDFKSVYSLYQKGRFFRLDKVVVYGDSKHKNHRIRLRNQPANSAGHYPKYIAQSVNGVVDIVEHKKMEPLFYMTDDPGIWAGLQQ